MRQAGVATGHPPPPMLWPTTAMGPAANWPAKLLPRVLFSWLRLAGGGGRSTLVKLKGH